MFGDIKKKKKKERKENDMLKLIKRKLERLHYNNKVSSRAKTITMDKSFYFVRIRGQFIKRNQHLLLVKF